MICCLSSCSNKDADPGFMNDVEFSGVVYDIDNPDSGVGNILVIFTSYEEDEDPAFEFPIIRDTARTSASGEFSLRTVCERDGWIFRISIADAEKDRPGGEYGLSPHFDPEIHVELAKHSFDYGEKIFRVDNIVVPLMRE